MDWCNYWEQDNHHTPLASQPGAKQQGRSNDIIATIIHQNNNRIFVDPSTYTYQYTRRT